MSTAPLSGLAPIPKGTLVFHDHFVFRWPENNNGDETDPDMLFHVSVSRGTVTLTADGFGAKGAYRNGSLLVKLSHWHEAHAQGMAARSAETKARPEGQQPGAAERHAPNNRITPGSAPTGEALTDEQEREAFEAWARQQPAWLIKDLQRYSNTGEYGHATSAVAWTVWKARAALATHPSAPVAPIPMLLFCPACGTQHVDAVESTLVWTGGAVPEPSHDEVTWDNPPHRSHLCHHCGCIWRPADVPTTGVKAIATKGKNTSVSKAAAGCNPQCCRQPAPQN